MSPIPGMAEEPGTEVHARLSVKVPACRWHKKGVPYLDTFHYIHLDGSGWNWPITTLYGDRLLPAHTGVCNSLRYVCPQCGGIHGNSNRLYCNVCYPLYYTQTPRHDHERDVQRNTREKYYPSTLFKRTAHTRIQKLPANSEIIHLLNIRIWKD